ncbi:MAG: hypothetical protein E7308_07025 [Butyrivibrio sp.]|nr:hypothetical protein [Butyrivibrio sp.]
MEGFKSKNQFSTVINTEELKQEDNKQLDNNLLFNPQSVKDLNSIDGDDESIIKKSDENSLLTDSFIEENKEFLSTGKDILGEANEKEFLLDQKKSEDFVNAMSMNDSVRFTEHRSRLIADALNVVQGDNYMSAGDVLKGFSKKIVKKGKFDAKAINDGKAVLARIDEVFVEKNANPSDKEKDFYQSMGKTSTIDFLKVDDMSFKDFVKKKYSYDGRDLDSASSTEIYSAYVAMILRRQNHTITLVRPTFDGTMADVKIKSLNVLFDEKNREVQGKNIRSVIRNKQYEDICRAQYKKEALSEASIAVRRSSQKESLPQDDLLSLREDLRKAGKGKHKNYDDFVKSFDKVLDLLESLSLNADQELDQKTFGTLYLNIQGAIAKADDYLNGKKMNLPRHHAVKNILDTLKGHQEFYATFLNDNTFKNPQTKVAINDLVTNSLVKTADTLSYENLMYKDKVSFEEFKEKGGATNHRYCTIAEADKIVESSHELLCAVKVPGHPLLREIKPSMPENITLKTQEVVPYRKTMQYLFKAIGRIMFDENGKFIGNDKIFKSKLDINEKAKNEEEPVLNRIDNLLGSVFDIRDIAKAQETLAEIIAPEIATIMKEEARKNGKKLSDEDAQIDARNMCIDLVNIQKERNDPLVNDTNLLFFRFGYNLKTLRTLDREKFMKDKDVDALLKSGDYTKEDINEVLDDFLKQADDAEKELSKIRDINLDEKEVPVFNSDISNRRFYESCSEQCTDYTPELLEHKQLAPYKANPRAFLDSIEQIAKNYALCNIGDEANASEEYVMNQVKKFRAELDDPDHPGEIVSKADFTNFAARFTKYQNYHSIVVGRSNGYYQTMEVKTIDPLTIIAPPLSSSTYIGKFKIPENEDSVYDEEDNSYHPESYNKYHDNDDPLDYIRTKKATIKSKIGKILLDKIQIETIRAVRDF